MAWCMDTNRGGVPPPSRAVVPFVFYDKQNHISSPDRLDAICVITPTNTQQGLAQGTPAGFLTAAMGLNPKYKAQQSRRGLSKITNSSNTMFHKAPDRKTNRTS